MVTRVKPMGSTIIFSFSLGLIFGGIVTAAISINEIKKLRKMLSIDNYENEKQVFKK